MVAARLDTVAALATRVDTFAVIAPILLVVIWAVEMLPLFTLDMLASRKNAWS